MELAVVALAGGWAYSTFLFLRYMRSRDVKETHLMNRIQSPETAVIESQEVIPGTVYYTGEDAENGTRAD